MRRMAETAMFLVAFDNLVVGAAYRAADFTVFVDVVAFARCT